MPLVLDIPPDVQAALRLPPEDAVRELRKELAVALYGRRILPLGKARVLAGLTKWEFEELLGARDVVRDYTGEDLRTDLAYGRAGGRGSQ